MLDAASASPKPKWKTQRQSIFSTLGCSGSLRACERNFVSTSLALPLKLEAAFLELYNKNITGSAVVAGCLPLPD